MALAADQPAFDPVLHAFYESTGGVADDINPLGSIRQ
jgi:hypothetical protein